MNQHVAFTIGAMQKQRIKQLEDAVQQLKDQDHPCNCNSTYDGTEVSKIERDAKTNAGKAIAMATNELKSPKIRPGSGILPSVHNYKAEVT